MSSFPTTLSDLTSQSSFDSAHQANIYKILSSLRKSTLSIPNRLLSIREDAQFVDALRQHLDSHCPFQPTSSKPSTLPDQGSHHTTDDHDKILPGNWPFIPNERSGSWPVGPQLKINSQRAYLPSPAGQPLSLPVSAYFKSTDGHVNQWSFSTRRLNLPVLSLLGSAGGAVLVDTTRRGKAYPDALRRTVPIFTSVWNRLLFEDFMRSGVCDFQGFGLEKGEISQIESRLPTFVRDLKGLSLDLGDIKRRLGKPVRCIWMSQPSGRAEWLATFNEIVEQIRRETNRWKEIGGVNILICCSASRKVVGAEMSDEGYIQGAGDDSEGWSLGLTAKLFWENYESLMDAVTTGGNIEGLVEDLVQREKQNRVVDNIVLVQPTQNMFLSAGSIGVTNFDLIIDCNASASENREKLFGLGCKEGKVGSKMLREQLHKVKNIAERILRSHQDARILVRCSTGRDLSVGVTLTLLCGLFDDSGIVRIDDARYVDKQFIKQRLAWITTSKPDANPSRATLQAVNSFLMDRPD